MLSLAGRPSRNCSGPSRREFLRAGGLAVGGLSLPTLLRARAGESANKNKPRAKSCLLIFMDGGPSHLEMWDMKPEAPAEVRGEFKPIRSSVTGVTVGELLPLTAREMHHFAQVRSVHHGVNDHNAGSFYMLTGKHPADGSKLVQTDSASTFPPFGAVAAKLRPVEKAIPPYVLLPEYQWNNGVDIGGQKGGFLGAKSDPFVSGDPSLPSFSVPGLDLLPEVPLDRLNQRDDLRNALDAAIAKRGDSAAAQRLNVFQRQAVEVVTSPDARRAFDLTHEPRELRERYGTDVGSDRSIEARKFGGLPHIGQTFLMARRMIEAGVRLVTVMTGRRIDQAWDTHRDHFGLMKKALCPPFDQALSALISDMDARGLLDETLVVVMGEFGRTPKIGFVTSSAGASKSNGRDHWPYCYTVLFAGAGVSGGTIYGSSDRTAAFPRENPVGPEDIAATIYELLGIDPTTELHDTQNKPYTLCTGKPICSVMS
ncbi:hypothetical protein VT84_32360 [Gemmata sp. SH-PL17]|uniref:DUF1501 domain-containing protein n=1 Tax=Gemmata sp. SH-PL17 TaxID=1630693 RepID=UPI00078BB862|nr:DUF1501 domain-containing protein [Gemmata sp. SH-PL17]AMV29133.1 hypothetical protein VT84_32360 [Gemmata sp. SH-PL17]